jgi:hypothetical protein
MAAPATRGLCRLACHLQRLYATGLPDKPAAPQRHGDDQYETCCRDWKTCAASKSKPAFCHAAHRLQSKLFFKFESKVKNEKPAKAGFVSHN